jgi:UDP-2,4-diacetamido-2,4,6-trideoxy-beta-L-altropyranose hydrolase
VRVAVRVDAGQRIGGGHAMRCLTLADALSKEGAQVNFATAAMPASLADRILAAGHGLIRLPRSAELQRERTDWHRPPLEAHAQQHDAEATEAGCSAVDWMIVDHYLLDHHWHSAARRFAERILVIDDLANRPYDCDLLVDEACGRSPTDYDGLVPAQTIVLAGANYALLRPEFALERPAARERRSEPKPVGRILVSLGATDPAAMTATAVDAVLAAALDSAIDVVLAPEAESLAHVQELARQHPNVAIHVNSNRMAELMRDADLAIGAAGTTSWERCCLGLPAIVLVLAENQRPNADALAAAGAALGVAGPDQIGGAVAELLSDLQGLHRMSAAAFELTDGRGTSRVAEEVLSRALVHPGAARK